MDRVRGAVCLSALSLLPQCCPWRSTYLYCTRARHVSGRGVPVASPDAGTGHGGRPTMPMYQADGDPPYFRATVSPDAALVLDTGVPHVQPIVLLVKETEGDSTTTDALCV